MTKMLAIKQRNSNHQASTQCKSRIKVTSARDGLRPLWDDPWRCLLPVSNAKPQNLQKLKHNHSKAEFQSTTSRDYPKNTKIRDNHPNSCEISTHILNKLSNSEEKVTYCTCYEAARTQSQRQKNHNPNPPAPESPHRNSSPNWSPQLQSSFCQFLSTPPIQHSEQNPTHHHSTKFTENSHHLLRPKNPTIPVQSLPNSTLKLKISGFSQSYKASSHERNWSHLKDVLSLSPCCLSTLFQLQNRHSHILQTLDLLQKLLIVYH